LGVTGYGSKQKSFPLETRPCNLDGNGDVKQKWEVWADGTIRSLASGQCLVQNGSGKQRLAVTDLFCNGEENQQWELGDDLRH
jgi:hypothetical protein